MYRMAACVRSDADNEMQSVRPPRILATIITTARQVGQDY